MNSLQIFNYQANEVRTIMKDGEPWWVLKDVCAVLGLSEPHRVATRLDEDERTQMTVTDSLGRNQATTVINESGLYNVILRSDKPEAKKFRRWITHDVIPQIRATGGYNVQSLESLICSPEMVIGLATKLKAETEAKEQLLLQAELDQPKIDFTDSIIATEDVISVGEMAKKLNQMGFDIGEKRFYKWLREKGYIIKQSRDNFPTQKAMDLGLFFVASSSMSVSGKVKIWHTPKVTGKGQVYFINKFLSARALAREEERALWLMN
jgi:anti-repressor protein